MVPNRYEKAPTDAVYAQRKQRIRLRQVNELTLARMRKMIESNQQRRRPVQPANRIPVSDMAHDGWVLGVAVQMWQPRCLLEGGPVGAHRQYDDVVLDLGEPS